MSDSPRRLSSLVLGGLCVVLVASLAIAWSGLFESELVRGFVRASGGLIQPTLVASAISAVLVAIVARPTLGELGLARGLRTGISVFVLGYAVIQLGLAIAA